MGVLNLIGSVALVGCSPPQNTIVEETDTYSYEDVLAEIEAEEAAENQPAE